MFKLNAHGIGVAVVCASALCLQACGQSNENAAAPEIKAAPKLTHDATVYAQKAWEFMNQADAFVYDKKLDVLDTEVRQPARKLSTDWRINVKMTDSVTEGKYALCRKALTSLEIFARATLEQSGSIESKQADYERDKSQCQYAIENPELGNTDPKQKGNAIANMQ